MPHARVNSPEVYIVMCCLDACVLAVPLSLAFLHNSSLASIAVVFILEQYNLLSLCQAGAYVQDYRQAEVQKYTTFRSEQQNKPSSWMVGGGRQACKDPELLFCNPEQALCLDVISMIITILGGGGQGKGGGGGTARGRCGGGPPPGAAGEARKAAEREEGDHGCCLKFPFAGGEISLLS